MSGSTRSFVSRVGRSLARRARKAYRLSFAMPRAGVAYMPPNFIYFPRFSSDSIVIDVGCSYEAELSVSLIEKFGVTAYAVDPTHKHAAALAELADTHRPRFVHLPVAVCAADGPVTFHESSENESGSVRSDHINVLKDTVSSYQVEGLTPMSLLKRIGVVEADLIKLDIEGAEYDLLRQIDGADLAPFKQIFVEFHHHAVAAYSEGDTRELVRRIENFGFKAYSADDHNYLFDRSGISME